MLLDDREQRLYYTCFHKETTLNISLTNLYSMHPCFSIIYCKTDLKIERIFQIFQFLFVFTTADVAAVKRLTVLHCGAVYTVWSLLSSHSFRDLLTDYMMVSNAPNRPKLACLARKH